MILLRCGPICSALLRLSAAHESEEISVCPIDFNSGIKIKMLSFFPFLHTHWAHLVIRHIYPFEWAILIQQLIAPEQ